MLDHCLWIQSNPRPVDLELDSLLLLYRLKNSLKNDPIKALITYKEKMGEFAIQFVILND